MIDRPWPRFPVTYDKGLGAALSIGVIALAEDRAGVWDFDQFLKDIPDIGVFSTRLPMSADVTPQSLAQMGEHLGFAAETPLPGSHLDAIAFSCTAGTVAIGLDKVHQIISAARPGVAISTPIEAGLAALRHLGTRRLALLTPYRPATADLVADFFAEKGLSIEACLTLALTGDLDMNRVSADCLIAAGRACLAQAPGSEALFISCTGLRTSAVIQRLEDEIKVPVVTSNQALAWHCLRIAGKTQAVSGYGRLFAE